MVETISEINGTIDQFDLSNGRAEQPPAQTALVTGYDFLTDGATAAADSESAQLGSDKVARLICENWTRQDLIDNLIGPQATTPSNCLDSNAPAPPPDIAGLNGHADNYRLLPAAGNASGSQTHLFTSADVTSLPLGRVIFSMGCHFGLNLPDVPSVWDWQGPKSRSVFSLLRQSSEQYGWRVGTWQVSVLYSA